MKNKLNVSKNVILTDDDLTKKYGIINSKHLDLFRPLNIANEVKAVYSTLSLVEDEVSSIPNFSDGAFSILPSVKLLVLLRKYYNNNSDRFCGVNPVNVCLLLIDVLRYIANSTYKNQFAESLINFYSTMMLKTYMWETSYNPVHALLTWLMYGQLPGDPHSYINEFDTELGIHDPDNHSLYDFVIDGGKEIKIRYNSIGEIMLYISELRSYLLEFAPSAAAFLNDLIVAHDLSPRNFDKIWILGSPAQLAANNAVDSYYDAMNVFTGKSPKKEPKIKDIDNLSSTISTTSSRKKGK